MPNDRSQNAGERERALQIDEAEGAVVRMTGVTVQCISRERERKCEVWIDTLITILASSIV